MREIEFNDVSEKAALGDKVHLQKQVQEVVKCEVSGVPMLNIDADQLFPGDLRFIKKLGLTISNPETEAPVALGVEHKTFGRRLADWLETSSDDDDDDDSDFFDTSVATGLGGFFGSSSSGGFGGSFGGGFGGFGGGGFSGGGASRGF